MASTGFIGTGTIGGPMALRLLDREPELQVYDISPAAIEAHVGAGAIAADSMAALAHDCETVFLSLPGPAQIEAVVLGDDGLLAHAGAMRTIVDLSTNALALNRRIAALAEAQGIAYLDAPVSGGKVAAKDGKLAVMIGGDEAAFERVRPLIESFGQHISYMGPPGSGTLTKLVNNQIFLCASVLVQEGFVMGVKAGMEPAALLEVLKASSAGPMVARAPLVLSRNFNLDVFALSIAAKDVGVALESGRDVGASMPLTAAAHDVYEQAIDAGLGGEDFFATVKILEAAAGVEMPPLKPGSES